LVLGTGIARGQYYWTLDTGCLAWHGIVLTLMTGKQYRYKMSKTSIWGTICREFESEVPILGPTLQTFIQNN